MRKRLKKKRRSCAMCKPHKAGRWKAREKMLLGLYERGRE